MCVLNKAISIPTEWINPWVSLVENGGCGKKNTYRIWPILPDNLGTPVFSALI